MQFTRPIYCKWMFRDASAALDWFKHERRLGRGWREAYWRAVSMYGWGKWRRMALTKISSETKVISRPVQTFLNIFVRNPKHF